MLEASEANEIVRYARAMGYRARIAEDSSAVLISVPMEDDEPVMSMDEARDLLAH